MQAILLAAGQSKRVKPIEDKNFIRFCDKYLIEWQLEALKEAGFVDLLIIGNKINLSRIENFVKTSKNREKFPINIKFSLQHDISDGMAGAILDAKQSLDKENIMIVSGNDIVDIEAYKLILKSAKTDNDAAIIGYKVKEYFPGGYLELSGGKLLNIVEKPDLGSEPSDMINLVIHFFKDSNQLISYLEREVKDKSKDDVYERTISKMIKDGANIQVVPYTGFWQAIKYPWHIFIVQKYFFEKLYSEKIQHVSEGPAWIAQSAQIADSAIINGKVIIEEGVKIFDNAVIQGPSYIGKNSIIANNSLLRDSVLGEQCVIGYSTEIARSNLQDDVWTHSNYIGDSYIGSSVSFGAGSVTGNLRLDEKNINYGDLDTGLNKFGLVAGENIRVGINVSFMPGVKIGANSMIAAGLVIDEDIPEDSFVKGEIKLKIVKNKLKVTSDRDDARKKLQT